METKILHNMINILTLTTLFFLVSLSQAKTSKHSLKHLRIDLMHIDSKGNYSKSELLQRMTRRSHQRMIHLVRKTKNHSQLDSKQVTGAQTDAYLGSGEFVMDIAIGTPSKSFSAIIDTGSDLVWTQCKPCKRCFKQSNSVFDPSKSSTYKNLPCTVKMCKALPTKKCGKRNASCEYLYGYADQSFTVGNLASETFTLGSQSVKNIAFGCGNNNTDGFDKSSGLVGLGREPLSLISQLGFKKFSYCFASLNLEKHSPMFFGSLARLKASAVAGPTKTTPLVKNPIYPSFYYLSLLGVTVGSTKLNIPSSTFALNMSDGTGGMIIDSGTTFTYLEAAAYNAAKKAFISQMKLPVADGSDIGFDVCFKPKKNASSDLPKFILHFDGADLDLPKSNYIFHDSDTGLLCLTITASAGISILGNMQQQNLFIKYDLGKNKLSFTPTQCDKL